jgi:hypothetical protein
LNLSNTYAGWTKQHWVRTHDSILNSADMGFSLDIGDYTPSFQMALAWLYNALPDGISVTGRYMELRWYSFGSICSK